MYWNLESAGSPDVDIITELQQKITILELKLDDCEEELTKVKNENELLLGWQFSLDKIKDDVSAILFYTGFPSYQALISFYKFIEPKLGKMRLKMRLKAGLFVQDLDDRFGISISLVSRICITWITLFYFELQTIFSFPTQELVHKNMPAEFAELYRDFFSAAVCNARTVWNLVRL